MRKTSAAVDLVMILTFVAIGRSVHDHGVRLAGMASTTWPFAAGLALGCVVLAVRRRSSTSLSGGLTVCVVTVATGMALRAISGQGIAWAFVIVALAFLGAMMLGWRVLLRGLRGLRRAQHPA